MDSTTLEPFDPEAAGTFSDYAERLEFHFESVDLDLSSVFPSDPDYNAKLERLRSKRRAVLLSNCGPKCFEVLKSLAAPASVKDLSYEELKDLAVQHFDGNSNPIKGRFEFCSRLRGPNESFYKFHLDLLELAKHCSFGKSLEERLRDQIVVGIRDENIVTELTSNKNLSYRDAVTVCSGMDAERKGTLNLQNREMTVIPDDVYKLNDPELLQNLVGADDDLKWWETEPIAKLYLCSNKITTITPAIAGLNSLTLLDLRDNQLETVPEELSQLEVLVRLELSHNKLTTLPTTLGPALQQISLNNNNFEIMPPAISSLRSLQTLDIRENRLTTLGELPCCLQSLVVDDNKLSALHIENHQTLAAITATNNVLTSCRIGNLPQLKVLSVRVNKLEYLEPILNCPELGEILVGKNFINNIDFVVPCGAALTVLDCSDNKVTVLPEAITSMSKLKRLDVSNNSLNILPPQLALMDNLSSLSVEGNPLRTMRREIIAKGTNAIKDYLKLKLQPDSLEEAGPTIPDIKPDEIMMQTKTLELDRKTTVPNELWDQAVVCSIVRLSMQYCGLTVIPEQALNLRGSLQELELGSNNLHQLPPEIGKLVKLRKLNLLNNNLKELPEEISSLVALEDVNLGQNKFEHIPECLYSLPGICNLIISNNQIRTVEPAKLITMTSLVCLDLENNNIGRLPPELSLIPNIRTLLVMGNTFKIPRADVLAKGSAEVIAWLKNKVPQP